MASAAALPATEKIRDTKETRTYPSALATNYSQRVSASPFNRPIAAGSLVLPHQAIKMNPFLARGGRLKLPYPRSDQARMVWKIIPKSDKTSQYLQMRRKLSGDKWKTLVQWCRQNGLDTLAEYELRTRLAIQSDLHGAGYKSILNQWLPYGEKHQSPYVFALPVKGVWSVAVDHSRHHRANALTAFALDLMVLKDGRRYRGDPRQNSSFHSWSQPVYAQAEGIVERTCSIYDDMTPGKRGLASKTNYIVIDYGAGILALYSHLQKGSVKVKAGKRVRAGQEIARVGNSGYSGHPHLHYAMMDSTGFSIKGRYKFQQRTGRGDWLQIDADDMKEGTEIRPIPTTSTPKSKSATTRPKPADRSPGQLAAARLRLSRAYLSYGKIDQARALLKSIVKDYPTTPAAIEAARELKRKPAKPPGAR